MNLGPLASHLICWSLLSFITWECALRWELECWTLVDLRRAILSPHLQCVSDFVFVATTYYK